MTGSDKVEVREIHTLLIYVLYVNIYNMSFELHNFDTDREARDFVSERVDVPIPERIEDIGRSIVLRSYTEDLGDGTFTNVYDLSFRAESVHPSVELSNQLTSVFDYVKGSTDVRVATGGGFFFLADRASAMPRQLGLNLALQGGRLHGLPVVDREAVLIGNERLSTRYLQALGTLSMGATELGWSGSLTQYETEAKIFATGNSIVTHVQNDETGSIRVLEESSRYTPVIDSDDTVDIGFVLREDGTFAGINSSTSGYLDIFSHDVVVRTHERNIHGGLPDMRVLSLGGMALDGSLRGALSVGPLLETEYFAAHPINKDLSLGGKPPFLDVPLARTVLYGTADEKVHIQLFDGRPGSSIFPGVTPRGAARLAGQNEDVTWGCFLDPGQTAKLVVRGDNDIESYGNAHYLKWPTEPGGKFVWTPKSGRPVASMIALR